MPEPDTGLRRTPLWKEITIILVIKAVALYLIWLAFFSHPVVKHLDAGAVSGLLLKPVPQRVQPPSSQEPGNAARPGTR